MASQEVLTALESLHRELGKLEPAIKHVETAQQVTKMVQDIPKMHLDLIDELIKSDSEFKNAILKNCDQEVMKICDESKKLQKVTADIQSKILADQAALAIVRDKIEGFHDRVEKINFPERLDKLDANVAGIMAATQSVQSRLDVLERNISDRLIDLSDYQKDTRLSLHSSIEKTENSLKVSLKDLSNKIQKANYITWGLQFLSVMGICLLVARAMKLI